jgi:hypothetical protein
MSFVVRRGGSARSALPQGCAEINDNPSAPPYLVLVLVLIVGLIGCVAAYGVFRMQRWAVILTLCTDGAHRARSVGWHRFQSAPG